MMHFLHKMSCMIFFLFTSSICGAFSVGSPKAIFGVQGAGWVSSDWNWGSPFGTGHDCAMVCRRRFNTPEKREELVNALIEADGSDGLDFEEVKLVLALVWQKARKTGLESYGVVLDEMAKAERYEVGDDEDCSRLFVQDIQKRYIWLDPEVDDKVAMNLLWYETEDYDVARRRCSGLVLKSIGFIKDGF